MSDDIEQVDGHVLDEEDEQSANPSSFWNSAVETLRLIAIAVVIAFVIKTLLVQAFYIPSASMQNTLLIGDRVLVEKVSYRLHSPERGDVVVFRRPGRETNMWLPSELLRSFGEGIGLVRPDPNRDLIKRIIGLPGDTVVIDAGVVSVNGVVLDEPYIQLDPRSFGPYTVPEGEIFVMGDNRPNSLDSRFDLGTVPIENVVGRTFAIIWPKGSATTHLGADYEGITETIGE